MFWSSLCWMPLTLKAVVFFRPYDGVSERKMLYLYRSRLVCWTSFETLVYRQWAIGRGCGVILRRALGSVGYEDNSLGSTRPLQRLCVRPAAVNVDAVGTIFETALHAAKRLWQQPKSRIVLVGRPTVRNACRTQDSNLI